ncbi:MAG: FAD-dependent oxidoreductase [Paracoccaceae bacterium]|nr:FAD-dependent oxidoreductase [Paracoccaceae bacterium]
MSANGLPDHAGAVVIGGGIMGCSTLYHLAKMGVSDAILLERNRLTSGTTWHSAAQVRMLRHSRNLTRMIRYSVDLYKRLETETGQSVGWIRNGSLSIATCRDRLIHIRRQEALAHAYGVNAKSMTTGEALERWPLMNSGDVLGAVWSPDDGRVSPSDVCSALVRAARGLGARLFERTGVTGILTRNGSVYGVETAAGVVRCGAIALCGGLWSRDLGAMAGAAVPVLACEHFYLLTRPVDGIAGILPTLGDHDGHLYIRDDGGGLLVGCFEPVGKPIAPGELDETFEFGLLPEDWDHFEPMMKRALRRLPVLERAEVKMLLNGPESFTPDGMFMLGETAETRGLYLGCGMNSVGVASGGGAGMNLAHCIVHGRPAYDLTEADAQRFAPVFNSVEHLMDRIPEVLGSHYDIAYPGKQLKTARNLRALPLDKEHRRARARMEQVFGWERPLYFGRDRKPRLRFDRPDWFESVRSEVMAAHEAAAVFDTSSFGKIDVKGPDSEAFLLKVCAGHMNRPPGTVVYTAVLNELGTYESDLIAQRFTSHHYRLFTGSGAIGRDLSWLSRAAAGFDVRLTDCTERHALLGLMGPDAATVAAKCGADTSALDGLEYFRLGSVSIAGNPVVAARMSYVGEAGWEFTCKSENARAVHQALVRAGARPAGSLAQTSMRIEKGFRAMGHELDGDISPIEAGLAFATRRSGGFVGFEAMSKRCVAGSRPELVSLVLDDPTACPLGHEPVFQGENIIGQTTSCAFGYRVGGPVALARLSRPPADGSRVRIDIAREMFDAIVQAGPAFDPAGVRMKTSSNSD